MTRLFFVALMAALIASCGGSASSTATETTGTPPAGKTVNISGQIKNAGSLQAVLDELVPGQQPKPVAKTDLSSDGTINLKAEGLVHGLYQFRIGAKAVPLILKGDEGTVKLSGDLNDLEKFNYTIEGSAASTRVAAACNSMVNGKLTADAMRAMAEKEEDPLVAMILTQLSAKQLDEGVMNAFRSASKKLNEKMPNSAYAIGFSNQLMSLEAQFAQLKSGGGTPQQGQSGVAVGQKAPDISLPNPEGKVLSLSSLKGKVILLDFWASWCGPCRRINPHVVELYNRYKEKGLVIFNVSLDGVDPRMQSRLSPEQFAAEREKGKQKWISAIKQDKLDWPYHVSDLGHWGSAPAQVYGVNSIPATFLIDQKGTIVARIEPGADPEPAIKKLLN